MPSLNKNSIICVKTEHSKQAIQIMKKRLSRRKITLYMTSMKIFESFEEKKCQKRNIKDKH